MNTAFGPRRLIGARVIAAIECVTAGPGSRFATTMPRWGP